MGERRGAHNANGRALPWVCGRQPGEAHAALSPGADRLSRAPTLARTSLVRWSSWRPCGARTLGVRGTRLQVCGPPPVGEVCRGAAFYSTPKATGAPGGWTGGLGCSVAGLAAAGPWGGVCGEQGSCPRGVGEGPGAAQNRAHRLASAPLLPGRPLLRGDRVLLAVRRCQDTVKSGRSVPRGRDLHQVLITGNITAFLPVFSRELEAQKGQMTLEPDWRQGAVTEPRCACIQTWFWAFGELSMGPRPWGVSGACGCAGSLGARVCRQGGKDSCSTMDPEPGMQPPSGVSPPRGSVPMQDTDVSKSGVWGASF